MNQTTNIINKLLKYLSIFLVLYFISSALWIIYIGFTNHQNNVEICERNGYEVGEINNRVVCIKGNTWKLPKDI